jgi:hypothetical protein
LILDTRFSQLDVRKGVKKFFKLAVLGAQVTAHLIDFLPRGHEGAKKN